AAHTARDSVTGADAVAARLHDPGLGVSAHAAFVHGMDLVLTACGAIALVTGVLAALFLPRRAAAAPTVAEGAAQRAESVA
ncbi:MFS transporter, partial [Streptomyces sp. SID10815]|nr:MFS transporter [Streptomyces sp. SID10815]